MLPIVLSPHFLPLCSKISLLTLLLPFHLGISFPAFPAANAKSFFQGSTPWEEVGSPPPQHVQPSTQPGQDTRTSWLLIYGTWKVMPTHTAPRPLKMTLKINEKACQYLALHNTYHFLLISLIPASTAHLYFSPRPSQNFFLYMMDLRKTHGESMSPIFEAAKWAAYPKRRLLSCACNCISQNPFIALQRNWFQIKQVFPRI